jgi:membrane dipeptidase
MRFIIDSHEDMAWNIINLQRDVTLSAYETRRAEKNTPNPQFNGNTLLGWPQYQQGKIALIFGTLFCTPARCSKGIFDEAVYHNNQEAHRAYLDNLDAYKQLVNDHAEKFRLITQQNTCAAHLEQWENHLEKPQDPPPPVGIVILMEGAEGIRETAEVEFWYEQGVRIIGPAWAGNRFCGGTREPGPLTKDGFALLESMGDIGMILDISHMDHQAARQALDFYPGQVIASHANAEALIRGNPTNRHLKDETIQQLIERDGVMGIIPLNSFLRWDWRDHGGRQSMGLEEVATQIDHVCQLAGSTQHVGLGTDFDGGFGVESVPHEIDTIADLHKIAPHLVKKGYNEEDIDRIFFKNWQSILYQHLPS